MFQVVMNNQTIEMQGTNKELLNGLCNYVDNLTKTSLTLQDIEEAFSFIINELKKENKENRVKTVQEDGFTVHKINVDGLSTNEIKKLIGDILDKK